MHVRKVGTKGKYLVRERFTKMKAVKELLSTAVIWLTLTLVETVLGWAM